MEMDSLEFRVDKVTIHLMKVSHKVQSSHTLYTGSDGGSGGCRRGSCDIDSIGIPISSTVWDYMSAYDSTAEVIRTE